MRWEKFIRAGFRMPFYFHLFVEGQCRDLPQLIGWQPLSWLVVIERQYATVYHLPETPTDFAAFLRSRLTDPNFPELFFGAFERTDQELLKFSRMLSYHDYSH